ncbi:hypothetical protein [Chitinophaga sp. RAB17]|uniref:hypothetical protein n=1 Tax=Chitinophaga sp. RAB17 TaxID=3233049 RepID=UPI003F93E8D9
MVTIENYLRKVYLKDISRRRLAREDDFFPLDNNELVGENVKWFKGRHLMYIPGAVIITINGVTVLDFKDWDYPYWIYEQLCGCLDQIAKGEGFELSYLELGTLKVIPLNKKFCLFSYTLREIVSRIDCEMRELNIALISAALQAFYVADKYGSTDYSNDIKRLEDCLMILENQ